MWQSATLCLIPHEKKQELPGGWQDRCLPGEGSHSSLRWPRKAVWGDVNAKGPGAEWEPEARGPVGKTAEWERKSYVCTLMIEIFYM